jgi:hypothetical protein
LVVNPMERKIKGKRRGAHRVKLFIDVQSCILAMEP